MSVIRYSNPSPGFRVLEDIMTSTSAMNYKASSQKNLYSLLATNPGKFQTVTSTKVSSASSSPGIGSPSAFKLSIYNSMASLNIG